MKKILSTLWKWLNDASKIVAPRRCILCGRRLHNVKEGICLSCYNDLPFTHLRGEKGNSMERYLWLQFPLVRANAFLYYHPHSESNDIFLDLKYRNRPQVGVIFGRMMAKDLTGTDFFTGIDTIIPIPLAKDRLRHRGYNQSEMLAKGISQITGIPLDTESVKRIVSNPTQTRKNVMERKENVKNIFALSSHHTLTNKHILLVDDVMTTGSTIISCALEIAKAPDSKISILTLGLAGNHFAIEKGYG